MLSQPDIRPIKESGDLYELQEDFEFQLFGKRHTIPCGFKYDGASCANLLFQRDGIHRAAALVHDYLYVFEGEIPNGTTYTRQQADDLFRDMLVQYGVKSLHVKLAYWAVWVFGGLYWND